MQYPRIFRVRQRFERPLVTDIPAHVQHQLSGLALQSRVKPGQTVAITAGSRGIANIAEILRAIVQHFQALGAEPFLIPAMGSHGGGTAAGQVKILEGYGITEDFCGCAIRSSMETVEVCQAAEGFPVHFDRLAFEADHVVVCGRVKPHTGFVGDIESGLMKMMLIGLGKHAGAIVYHRAIQDYSFQQILRSVAREVLTRCQVVAGVAIVENAFEETAAIEAVAPEDFEIREKQLLVQARQWMPRLPFDQAQMVLIDEIGKNISGTGLDTNVVGRKFLDHRARDDESPKIKHIAVRDLTDATHGNATGVGLVEFCRTQVLEKMNTEVTRTNAITGGHVTGAMLPLDYATDREIFDAAFQVMGLTPPQDVQLMWIRNTLDVAELECSESFLDEAHSRDDLDVIVAPRDLPFDPAGNLPNVESLGATVPV